MKKFLALLFVAGMFSFAACSAEEGDAAEGDGENTEAPAEDGGEEAAH